MGTHIFISNNVIMKKLDLHVKTKINVHYYNIFCMKWMKKAEYGGSPQ
jgi:hypothetical protein